MQRSHKKGKQKAKYSLNIRERLAHPFPHQSPAKGGAGVVQHPQQTAPHPAVCLTAEKHELYAGLIDLGRTIQITVFRVSVHLIVEDLQVPEGSSAEHQTLWGAGQTLERAN